MSDDEIATTEKSPPKSGKKMGEGKVSLNQMLSALDKDVAVGIGKRLKKLSKKKAVAAPIDEHKLAQLERKEAYEVVSKEISKWDPIVERNRHAKQLSFPLDLQPDFLPSTAESIGGIRPRNELEKEVKDMIIKDEIQMNEQKELTKAEKRYQKAISAEEAKERHTELQKMRVKLSSYVAKMRRQKAIKSKSYRRLLKHERIRNHVQRVESNQDALLDEIERLQKLRAQERASLKHKNTGKWAKHAKFRAKYDEKARQEMLEQIGVARKLLDKPAMPNSDEDSDESDQEDIESNSTDDEEELSEISEKESSDEGEDIDDGGGQPEPVQEKADAIADRLVVSTELLKNRSKRKRKSSKSDNDDDANSLIVSGDEEGDDDSDDDEQRRLMSEAFADDNVVEEFQKTKDHIAGEEQPKDIDLFLPGWGGWAGPGITTSKRKRQKYVIKAKKLKRKDDSLNHVIISEAANESIKDLQPKQLPRGFKNDKHFQTVLTQPTTSTFTNQAAHRELVRPKIATRMGHRIEPIGQNQLGGMNKAKWS